MFDKICWDMCSRGRGGQLGRAGRWEGRRGTDLKLPVFRKSHLDSCSEYDACFQTCETRCACKLSIKAVCETCLPQQRVPDFTHAFHIHDNTFSVACLL